jgi:hypothetical protein
MHHKSFICCLPFLCYCTFIISGRYVQLTAHQTIHFGLCIALIPKALALMSNYKCRAWRAVDRTFSFLLSSKNILCIKRVMWSVCRQDAVTFELLLLYWDLNWWLLGSRRLLSPTMTSLSYYCSWWAACGFHQFIRIVMEMITYIPIYIHTYPKPASVYEEFDGSGKSERCIQRVWYIP